MTNAERFDWSEDTFVILSSVGTKSYPLKAVSPRDADEQRLMQALADLFAKQAPKVAAMLAKGEMPSDAELRDALSRVIEVNLVETATNEALRLGAQVGVQFDPALVNVAMAAWASRYTYDLVKQLDDTTRKVIQRAVSKFAETPGMTRGELVGLLEPAFGRARAEAIAVTEVTRAYSASVNEYQAELAAEGIQTERVWHTANDELVCPICGPKNGRPEKEWRDKFPDGPPAHVNCRCAESTRHVEGDNA